MTLVVDASVAVKWVLPRNDETLVDEALDILARHARKQIEFLVPDSFWAETGNVLWKAARQRRISPAEAKQCLQDLEDLQLPVVPVGPLLHSALSIALAHGRSVYDSLYVALAVRSHCDLLTADERLANALAARFPIKWLGAFSIT